MEAAAAFLLPRSTIVCISILSLAAALAEEGISKTERYGAPWGSPMSSSGQTDSVICFVDIMSTEVGPRQESPGLRDHVDSLRNLLLMLFQMANLLLLLASIVENSTLVQIYLWYTMAFLMLGMMVSSLDFLLQLRTLGFRCVWVFATEVAFLSVIFYCLPVADSYRKYLEGEKQSLKYN